MKTMYSKFVLLLLISSTSLMAQSPYAVSPYWVFGNFGKMTFPTGNFPVAGGPTQANSTFNQNNEASSAVCHKDYSLAIATNARTIQNGAGTTVRSPEADALCASSATAGAMCFPDPARNNYPSGTITNDAYYAILGNDQTGGACVNKGLNLYRFTGTGTGVVYNAGGTTFETSAFPAEGFTTASDGGNGYWIIAHTKATQNIFRVWHMTTAGLSGPTDYQAGADYNSGHAGNQSYMKVSPCQNRIAFIGGNTLTVHNFNRATGAVTGELLRVAGAGSGPGLEFSPSGNRIFYAQGIAGQVNWADIGAPNNSGSVGSIVSWSMQLGPDGKLYTSGAGNWGAASTIGVIGNPDAATPTGSNITLAGSAVIYNGFINQSWLSPEQPVVSNTGSGCSRTATFDFENYFNTDIPVNVSTVVWDFGDGSATVTGTLTPAPHTYPNTASATNYTVTVTFNDAFCGHTWTASQVVNITCPLPVELINFSGAVRGEGAMLSWQTAVELNNEYFDVQRSLDGVHFESIAHKPGAGNSNRVLSYNHLDTYDGSGTLYYRLVQHDFDGKTATSHVIALQFGKSITVPVSIAPNPFAESVVLTKLIDEQATIVVYDIMGRIVEQQTSSADESVVYLGSNLSKGTYLVTYISAQSSYTQRIEKQ